VRIDGSLAEAVHEYCRTHGAECPQYTRKGVIRNNEISPRCSRLLGSQYIESIEIRPFQCSICKITAIPIIAHVDVGFKSKPHKEPDMSHSEARRTPWLSFWSIVIPVILASSTTVQGLRFGMLVGNCRPMVRALLACPN